LFFGAPGQAWIVGKGDKEVAWKYEYGTQQVQVLLRKGIAKHLEASLARRMGDQRREA